MVNVAIAGGTGAVGRTLIEVMNSQTKHKAVVLTRKVHQFHPGCTVDYSDVGSLTSFLESQNIHTIISVFGINATSLSVSQLALIKAAEASSVTKRFIPSSFAISYPEDGVSILPLLAHYFDSLRALEATNLEWAPVHNGTFLDCFAPAALKTHHPASVLVLDIYHNAAAIPGDGNTPVTFTYTFDVARFVVASLDLEKWPRELRIIGDELTFNEFLTMAEEVKGAKFSVAYDDVDKLRSSKITELPGHSASYDKYSKERLQWFLAIFETWMATGQGRIPREGTLNEMFPDIKPLTAKEMLERYWKAAP